jgi:cyclophilin family peptidyl-prolyl cis-trans isomerase
VPSQKRERQRVNRQSGRQVAAQARRRRDTRRRIGITVIVILVIIGVAGIVSVSQDDGQNVATATTLATTVPDTTTPTTTPGPAADPVCPAPDGSSPQIRQFTGPFENCLDPTKVYDMVFETDIGTFTARLNADRAPKTVNNMVALARYHYFDGITFHRVIQGFVIQGGDPTGSGSGGPGFEFEDELPDPSEYKEGSLAMANSGPNTNGSQFFVVTSAAGATQLVSASQGAARYSLWGQVTEGMDVVKKIEADGAAAGDPSNGKPAVVHRMVKVTVVESDR